MGGADAMTKLAEERALKKLKRMGVKFILSYFFTGKLKISQLTLKAAVLNWDGKLPVRPGWSWRDHFVYLTDIIGRIQLSLARNYR